ncbi:MAG: flagellar protein FliT [Betaproteobacteria bacterium]|nr:flagellar protein FliT [Betaproteobacteria bacterium]
MSLTDWPARYTELLNLSRLMLETASRQEWEKLAQQGEERTRLVAALPEQLPPLPEDSGRLIAEIVQEILECDRRVFDRVQPWLQHVGKMLAAFEKADKTA